MINDYPGGARYRQVLLFRHFNDIAAVEDVILAQKYLRTIFFSCMQINVRTLIKILKSVFSLNCNVQRKFCTKFLTGKLRTVLENVQPTVYNQNDFAYVHA